VTALGFVFSGVGSWATTAAILFFFSQIKTCGRYEQSSHKLRHRAWRNGGGLMSCELASKRHVILLRLVSAFSSMSRQISALAGCMNTEI
jgi:hypothetical protein